MTEATAGAGRLRLGDGPWLGFYGLILAAWAATLAMGAGAADGPLDALCRAAAEADATALVAMWAIMSAAMMAPGFAPAFAAYRDLSACGAADGRGAAALVGGYLAAWLGFSVIAAGAQGALSAQGLLGEAGESREGWLTAALLLAAGAYQFSAVRDACLARCRSPLAFFMERWRPGARAAFGMGARLGLWCLGCCWALMLLGFVGGVMAMWWMGAATLFMTLEKLPALGRPLTRPAGYALLAAGGAAAAGAML